MTLHRITLKAGADLQGFRRAVRWLNAEELAPQHVVFAIDDAPGLFGDEQTGDAPAVAIPKGVAQLIEPVVCHRDPERYALLYSLVWRVLNGERDLLEVASDPLVHRIDMMARSVRRDLHKMHAFVWSQHPDQLRRAVGEALTRHGIEYALTLSSGAQLVAAHGTEVGHLWVLVPASAGIEAA